MDQPPPPTHHPGEGGGEVQPLDPENQNLEKMKKILEDIIILQMFTINDNHMIYDFSDMECNRQNLVISDSFLPSYPPLTILKMKN